MAGEASGNAGAEKTLPDKIVVVGDSATVTGFKLAGVVENYVLTGKEGEQKVVELLDKENIGIVI
ncbi:MAG: V-type ATP synthase subunit F, partial [Candidatus Micrarchaeota archaeon]